MLKHKDSAMKTLILLPSLISIQKLPITNNSKINYFIQSPSQEMDRRVGGKQNTVAIKGI